MVTPPFNYYLSSPDLNEESNTPYILISGWISDEQENIIANPIIFNSDNYIHSLTSLSRPDVEAAYPNHSAMGFHEYLWIIDISSG